ncbi:hypothetical protein PUN4_550184 [Paraburkholderia unamae]|nr:hypothetical protein PUN4_550184 [Paraburkholderia unamae]
MSSAIMASTMALLKPARSPSLPVPNTKRLSLACLRAYVYASAAMSIAPACVDMCRPSATSASEPKRLPPTISATIIALHSAITIHVLRSLSSWAAPRKIWSCPAPKAASSNLLMFLSLEVAVDNFDQLLFPAAMIVVGFRVDEMGADMVLEHHGEQAVHRAAAARDELQHIHAAAFILKRALDGLDLSLDAAHPVKQFLFVANGVAHSGPLNTVGGYITLDRVLRYRFYLGACQEFPGTIRREAGACEGGACPGSGVAGVAAESPGSKLARFKPALSYTRIRSRRSIVSSGGMNNFLVIFGVSLFALSSLVFLVALLAGGVP